MATEPETMPLLKKFIGPTPDVFGVSDVWVDLQHAVSFITCLGYKSNH